MRNSREPQDDFTRKRAVNVNDSIYGGDPREKRKKDRRRDDYYDNDYDRYDDYDDGYDDYDRNNDRKRKERSSRYDDYYDYDDRKGNMKRSRYDDYDDYDDYGDEYEGGMSGNKKIVITTIIIAAICIIGILLIVFLGLKENVKKDGNAETTVEEVAAVETDTTAGSVDITAASVSEEQAMDIIYKSLVSNGTMSEDYSTADGGTFTFNSEGIIILNDTTYYMISTSFAPADNPENPTITYYGVNCQDGTWYLLNKTDTGISIVG